MSHEDAILARSNLIQENKQKVAEMKAEADRLMKDYLERRLKEEEVMRYGLSPRLSFVMRELQKIVVHWFPYQIYTLSFSVLFHLNSIQPALK